LVARKKRKPWVGDKPPIACSAVSLFRKKNGDVLLTFGWLSPEDRETVYVEARIALSKPVIKRLIDGLSNITMETNPQ